MKVPDLTGALQGLKVLDAGDRDRYRTAVEAGKQTGWGYYLPNLFAQNRVGRSAMLVIEDGGSMCIFRWRVRDSGPRLDLYLPPVPLRIDVLLRCLERANDFNGDRSARVLRIDAGDAEAIAGVSSLRVRQRRLQYVFEPRAYETLAGKRFYTIRRNVGHVERLPDVEVVPFSIDHLEACRDLLSRWRKVHREAHGTAGGAGGSRRALELAGTLPEGDLRGEVVFLDGRLVAFALGGEIRPGLACSFDRKCDTAVRGLSYFHFRSFLWSLRDFQRVNDGSDTGRAGLRQLKDSFRPVEMHAEFRARQR